MDLEELPGTKVYALPDDMPLRLATLAEPLTSCVRALRPRRPRRRLRAGGDRGRAGLGNRSGCWPPRRRRSWAPGGSSWWARRSAPRLELCRDFGAEATVSIDEHRTPAERIEAVRRIAGGFGADLALDCSGHPSAGPEGIEMLRDGGTYVEMGQFTDAGSIDTNWHRICTKDLNVLGSWGFTADDIATGIDLLYRARDRYPWLAMQTLFPFTEPGIAEAIDSARADAHREVHDRTVARPARPRRLRAQPLILSPCTR